MARKRFPQYLSDGRALENVMSRVMLISPTSSEELMTCIDTLETGIIQHSASLVVIDSIAALARADYGCGVSSVSRSHNIQDRQEMLGHVAARLKFIAETFKIPVVVTNQVTTRMTGQVTAHIFQQQNKGEGGYLTAALGTKWAHCVNIRLVMERLADKRYIRVAKSPLSANVSLQYVVTGLGLVEVLHAEIPEILNRNDMQELAISNDVEYFMT
jgi:RAD51-like protein 1